MEEKVLVESKSGKGWLTIAFIISLPFFIFCNICGILNAVEADFLLGWFIWLLIYAIIFGIIILIVKNIRKSQITVTDKRVTGKIRSRSIDLPIDSISAVGTRAFGGIIVSTSSGAIKFSDIANRDEIHKVIRELIIKRQEENKNIVVTAPVAESTSNADELKKYKELLDSGVITQEEFDAKKKQLLGL